MANYLPVLLVSVSTHAPVPDDSALSTQPRAQVDYLSHDWQEEDVWRSWRNMTRQKNEIANGVRLENASWRTWWKQRNKLKTVSPETLNWLKDSDVTWLYGPLHTAVEWTPPPKPQPVPDTVDTDPASAHDRLDLSSASKQLRPPQPQPAKPILKHRSISQFLTSDLPPTSPIFSPVESEDENDDPLSLLSHPLSSKAKGKRPTIPHTKSDTHIARWGPNRAFRKDSPPRIDPPGLDAHAAVPSSSSDSHPLSAGGSIRQSLSQDSNSSGSGGVSSERGSNSHHGQKKKHISFNTFVEQCIAIEKPKKNASGFFGPVDEGAWMGSRHGPVDDDGYEEDQEDSEEEAAAAAAAAQGVEWRRSSRGEEEEGGALGIRSDSEEEVEDEEEEEEDDGVIEMRSSTSYRPSSHMPKKKPSHRSQSKVSTTSSSSSTSTATSSSSASSHSTSNTTSSPSGSLSPSRRTSSSSHLNRKSSVSSSSTAVPYASSTSTSPSSTQPPIDPYAARAWRTAQSNTNSTYRPSAYRRPPLIRTPSDQPMHVTIAPIAPTILKTTGAWAEGFGDEGGASDDGFAGWGWGIGGSSGVIGGSEKDKKERKRGGSANGSGYGSSGGGSGGYKPGAFGTGTGRGGGSRFDDVDEGQISEGTPVELVYVPPFGSNYSLGLGEYDEPLDGPGTGPRGYPGYVDDDAEEEIEEGLGDAMYHHHTAGVDGIGFVPEPSLSQPISIGGKTVPSVVINTSSSSSRRRSSQDIEEEDPYDFFGGPDFGEDYYARRGGRGYSAYERSSGAGSSTSSSTTKTSDRDRDRVDRDVRASARQRERERERREVGTGEERQPRSRSRSQSRTPSPAFVSSPIVNGGEAVNATGNSNANATSCIGGGGSSSGLTSSSRRTGSGSSASASNPSSRQGSSSDLLAPPSRGRQPSEPSSSSYFNGARPQPVIQTQTQQRGRSSTRTPSSSSSSWERERGASVGSSPMGSLSPDGVPRAASGVSTSLAATSGISTGIGAVLAGSGRVERGDRDREQESRGSDRERGRERRGRERTSGKVLGASEAAVLGESSGSFGRRSGAAAAAANVAPASNINPIGPIAMDASFSSTTSTCSSTSNSTIMGPPTVVPSLQDEEEYPVAMTLHDQAQSPAEAQDAGESAELRYMRMAEEELNRIRTIPTPSNSPVLEMRMVAAVFGSENGNGGSGNSTSTSNSANTSTGTTTPTGSTATGTTSPPPSEMSGVKGGGSVAANPLGSVLGPTPVAGGIRASQPNPTSSTLSSGSPPTSSPAPALALPTPSPAASPISAPKLRPPPLIPTPPLPAKPSTSFTAVSSPRTPGSSGLTSASSRGHGHSPSPSIESISVNTPSTPSTIVGKAVDMMSSAGAYFGLWTRENAAAAAAAAATTSAPAL